MKTLRAKGI